MLKFILYLFKFNFQTHLDTKNRILYVHLESIYDTGNLLQILVKNSLDDLSKVGFKYSTHPFASEIIV